MKIGDKHSVTVEVTPELTAEHMGSGDMPVLATPAMIALMERAAKELIAPSLKKGETSVGVDLTIEHVRATPVGAKVTATAEIADIDENQVVFNVEAEDGKDKIGGGVHLRCIVDRERFLKRFR